MFRRASYDSAKLFLPFPDAALKTSKDNSANQPKSNTNSATKVKPSNSSQLTRGRTSVRSDANKDRSKSQPSSKKSSNANIGNRSSTPGRK